MDETLTIQKNLSDYLREIGRKGGFAGKGSPRRIAANRRSALNRNLKQMPRPKEIKENSC